MLETGFIKKGHGWLAQLPDDISPAPFEGESLIEERAIETNNTGKHPLWEGYEEVSNYPQSGNKFRSSNKVRTTSYYGRFYVELVEALNAKVVVEFGTAFGVSGMYWLSGLKRTGGKLFTYEPNQHWSIFAKENLAAVGGEYLLTNGTFEENAAKTLAPGSVDIGFIDAIHTSEFVFAQFDILRAYLKAGATVVFDDINFSRDMRECWHSIAEAEDVETSVTVSRRIGVITLKA